MLELNRDTVLNGWFDHPSGWWVFRVRQGGEVRSVRVTSLMLFELLKKAEETT